MSSGSGEAVPDPDLRAAEYVIGTLDAHERAELERELAIDPDAASRVRRVGGAAGALARCDPVRVAAAAVPRGAVAVAPWLSF